LAGALFVAAAGAGPEREAKLRLVRVAAGFDAPVHAAAPRSEPGRLYVVEQAGVVRVLVNGRRRASPFLDIRSLVGSSGSEQGLLSIAFDPGYAANRRFYVDYTDRGGDTRVVEYRSDGVKALPDTARELLFVDQPFANHNGGQLQLGPDGKLYVGMGDGGSGGDPENNGQNPRAKLGKLLRADPSDPDWEVAGYGLRNPWRFSFDRANGDLWIGDVGQGSWEEIDYRRRGAAPANFGWSRYEGRHPYGDVALSPSGPLVFPIAEYSHAQGCSVVGGYVYRGSSVRAARGRYFFGDSCSGYVWSLKARNGKATGLRREPFVVRSSSSYGLVSFAEGARGALYLVSHSGTIYRLAG
jgi:glucose/arabinose dehydrogenase